MKLYFRAGSKGDFESTNADVDGENVRASIPGASVKPPVMDYYFEVLDGAGNVVATRGDAQGPLRVAVPDKNGGGGGWVLPVAIGGAILGAAAIVGILALAGVFSSDSSPTPNGGGRGTSNVSISIDSQVEGGTASSIDCDNNALDAALAVGDVSSSATNLQPQEINCVIVIDP